MRRTTTTAAVGLTLAAAISLSGCIANPLDRLVEEVVSGGVENLIEDQLGEGIDINVPGEDGTAPLPADWPSTVPTPAGQIQFSASAEGGFQASILVDNQGEIDRVYAALESGGYVLENEGDLAGLTSRIYRGSEWTVIVGSIPDESTGEFTVQYLISPTTE